MFYLGVNSVEEWINQGEDIELEINSQYDVVKEQMKATSLQGLNV